VIKSYVLLLLLLGIDGFSVSNIKDTKHNLAYSKGGGIGSIENDELCVYCHTPSGTMSGSDSQPLWNKAISSKSFLIYSVTNVESSDKPVTANSSLACLSCHDGITAINVLANVSGYKRSNTTDTDLPALDSGVARLKIGEDKNHPVSVVYTSGVAGLKAISSALVGWAGVTNIDGLLRNNRVECGSCHDPHEATNGTFLRISNGKGDLCTGCHVK